MKAQLRELTKAVNKAMDDAYVTASGNIDAMAGAPNKKSENSKQLIKLRSKTRQAAKKQMPKPRHSGGRSEPAQRKQTKARAKTQSRQLTDNAGSKQYFAENISKNYVL